MTGCSSSGASGQVRTELESMRQLELDQETTDELLSMLDDEGKEDFDEFLSKAGDYDYKITGSTTNDSAGSTTVTVQIKAYCFGREYLKTWNDYLEESGEKDFDQAEFYKLLLERLSSVEDKTFRQEVDILCTDTDGDGVWETDAGSNYKLRNAMLGGMLQEIASLVDIEQ